jgi:hypothetical protein
MSKWLRNLARSIAVADPTLVSSAARAVDPVLAPATLLKKTDDLLPYAGRNIAKDLGLGPNAQNTAYILGNMTRRLPSMALGALGYDQLARYTAGTKGGVFNLLADTGEGKGGPTQAIAEASPEDEWWASLSPAEKQEFIAQTRSRQQRPEVIAARPEPAVVPIEAVETPPVRPVSLRELQENMITGYLGEKEVT